MFQRYPDKNEITEWVKRHHRKWPEEILEKRVSIIILNRDGCNHLKVCIPAILSETSCRNYEIIVVDNDSKDDSIKYVKSLENPILKVIRNNKNESFSIANNMAAGSATGEYLVFLNNDTEPLNGWLEEMLLTMDTNSAGIVGSKLIYPAKEASFLKSLINIQGYKSNSIQHAGILFMPYKGYSKPYNVGKSLNPFADEVNTQREYPAVTGASMMIKKDLFVRAGGFDSQYLYGLEDVDLCLKVRNMGYSVIYCPFSTLYHYEFGSQKDDVDDVVRDRRMNNLKIFNKKWRDYLMNHHEMWARKGS